MITDEFEHDARKAKRALELKEAMEAMNWNAHAVAAEFRLSKRNVDRMLAGDAGLKAEWLTDALVKMRAAIDASVA